MIDGLPLPFVSNVLTPFANSSPSWLAICRRCSTTIRTGLHGYDPGQRLREALCAVGNVTVRGWAPESAESEALHPGNYGRGVPTSSLTIERVHR